MSAWRNKTQILTPATTCGNAGLAKVKFFAALILLFAFQMEAETVVSDRFLNAVSFVESRNRDGAIGDNGRAVGRFQFHRAAWSQVSDRPFASARSSAARWEARKYCLWLESQLRRELKRQPTHAEVYAAYNCGLEGFRRHKFKVSLCPSVTKRNVKVIESKL